MRIRARSLEMLLMSMVDMTLYFVLVVFNTVTLIHKVYAKLQFFHEILPLNAVKKVSSM